MENSLAYRRADIIEQLKTSEPFDLIVIGGGIHGASAARLAAVSGLRCVMLEQADYASATSSRSSKMAHGGLRYLEMFDFEQVFEGIKAREESFEKLPHLVKPARFLIPVKKHDWWFRGKLSIGLRLYDWLVNQPERRHRWISRSKLKFDGFGSRAQELMGCFEYCDGLMDDARLVIENISAAREYGALCLNYAKVLRIQRVNESRMELHWQDVLTAKEYALSAKLVLNCAGPWAAGLCRASKAPAVRYSRGTHLLFSQPWRGPSLFLPLRDKARYYFVWPHPEGTLVGTTEREVAKVDGDPEPSVDEIEEILARLRKDLPQSGLDRSTLHYCFAGIRTLPLRSRSKTASRLSRKHIWHYDDGILTLFGGKYTTAGWTAREGIQQALKLGLRGKLPMSGLAGLPPALSREERERLISQLSDYGADPAAAVQVLDRFGRRSSALLQYAAPFTVISGRTFKCEVEYALDYEQVECLEDLLRRRTGIEYSPGHGLEALVDLVMLMRTHGIGTNYPEQVDSYRFRLERLHQLMGLAAAALPSTNSPNWGAAA